jgi:hypothetical protein
MLKILLLVLFIAAADLHAQPVKPKADSSFQKITVKYDKEVEAQVIKELELYWDRVLYFCVKNAFLYITYGRSEFYKIMWQDLSPKLREILMRKS